MEEDEQTAAADSLIVSISMALVFFITSIVNMNLRLIVSYLDEVENMSG